MTSMTHVSVARQPLTTLFYSCGFHRGESQETAPQPLGLDILANKHLVLRVRHFGSVGIRYKRLCINSVAFVSIIF
jgi:hypothetical protein